LCDAGLRSRALLLVGINLSEHWLVPNKYAAGLEICCPGGAYLNLDQAIPDCHRFSKRYATAV
jgi:hypothetical protein